MRSLLVLFALTVFSAVAAAAPSDRATGKIQLAANEKPAGEQLPHKGKVLSSMDASIYTYVEVLENGKTVWIAAPTVAVKKGDMISFSDGAVMSNFYSKSLNRTFDKVIFVGKAVASKK